MFKRDFHDSDSAKNLNNQNPIQKSIGCCRVDFMKEEGNQRKEADFFEICELINTHKDSVEKIIELLNNAPVDKPVIIDAMNMNTYEINEEFRKVLIMTQKRGVPIHVVLALGIPNQSIVDKLREQGIEVELVPQKELTSAGIPYWGDSFGSINAVIHLDPHDPWAKEHTHTGFLCKDQTLIRMVYLKLIELWGMAQQQKGFPVNMDYYANQVFYEKNKDIFDERFPDQYVLIERGNFICSELNIDDIWKRVNSEPYRRKMIVKVGEQNGRVFVPKL